MGEGAGSGVAAGAARLRSAFLRGVALTLAGAGLWGFSGACSQFVLAQGANPAFVTAVRALVAGALFLALLAVRKREALRRILADKRAAAQVCVFGFGLFGSQITFACSIDWTNAGTATVLQMLGSVFIMLYVSLRARSAPRAGEALGLAAALAATYLIATQGDFGVLRLPWQGIAWGVLNGLAVALYVVFPKEAGLFRRFGSVAVTGCGMAVAGALSVAVWLVQAALGAAGGGGQGVAAGGGGALVPALDAAGWLVLLGGVAVVGTFVAFGLYLGGVARVGSVAGGLLGAVEPLSATVLSALWLGTAFSWADWAGFALMAAMVALVTVSGERKQDAG